MRWRLSSLAYNGNEPRPMLLWRQKTLALALVSLLSPLYLTVRVVVGVYIYSFPGSVTSACTCICSNWIQLLNVTLAYFPAYRKFNQLTSQ